MTRKEPAPKTVIYYLQIIGICLPVILLVFLSLSSPRAERKVPEYDINPVVDAKIDPGTVTLYFRYAYSPFWEPLLCGEEQQIEVAANETHETAIVKALVMGPRGADARSVINPETRVYSVTRNKDCYFVLLSREFMEPYGLTKDRQSDPETVEEAMANQRLAVYSVVNSLTELGTCSRVQILIDVDGRGNGQRVPRRELGFTGGNADQPIEPLGRDGSLIRTPASSLEELIKLIMNGDLSSAYKGVAENSDENGETPSQDELAALISGKKSTISTYGILNETVAPNGRTAVVTINVSVKYGAGTGMELRRTLLPVKMIRENEVWKVAYMSLQNIFE